MATNLTFTGDSNDDKDPDKNDEDEGESARAEWQSRLARFTSRGMPWMQAVRQLAADDPVLHTRYVDESRANQLKKAAAEDDEDEEVASATAEWHSRLNRLLAEGIPRMEAVQKLGEENPFLRMRYIDEANGR